MTQNFKHLSGGTFPSSSPNLSKTDPELASILQHECQRVQQNLNLIASENYTSPTVLATLSNVFSNKYAEGYPGKRYYGGCEHVDDMENLAKNRLKRLFGADHVNVQPHSGTQANQGVFLACLKPGDGILGLKLSHGGHLSHGTAVNFSGVVYTSHEYGVDESTGYLDYDKILSIAQKTKPKLIIAGASAYPRIIDFKSFRHIADSVGAYLLADMAHTAGLVATGFHPSPVPYADFVTSTTHKTLRGPSGGIILCREQYAKAIDKAVCPGIQGKALMNTVAAKAVAFAEALRPEFKDYCGNIIANAKSLAGHLQELGLNLVSGGTDNHLMLCDLRNMSLTGKEAQDLLALANITSNRNTIPGDPQSPFVTSGIRLGTPAITTRGLKVADMKDLAQAIVLALKSKGSEPHESRELVARLCNQYPVYDGFLHTHGYITGENP